MIWPLLLHGIRADVSETPNNALTTRLHGDYRLSIDRFFVGFNAICSTFLRNNPICFEGRNCRLSSVLGYSINARAIGPRTPYRVGGLAGDFTSAWVSHSLVNHFGFKISKLHVCCVNYIFVLDKRNTAWLRDTVRQTSLGKSAAADFPRDVCLTVSRNHAVFLLSFCVKQGMGLGLLHVKQGLVSMWCQCNI